LHCILGVSEIIYRRTSTDFVKSLNFKARSLSKQNNVCFTFSD